MNTQTDMVNVSTTLAASWGGAVGQGAQQHSPRPWPRPPWPSSDGFYRRPGPSGGSPEDVFLSATQTTTRREAERRARTTEQVQTHAYVGGTATGCHDGVTLIFK